MLAGVGAAVAWLVAASEKNSALPSWPVVPFAALAVMGLYGMLAPLLRGWPWNRREPEAKAGHEAMFSSDPDGDLLVEILRLQWHGVQQVLAAVLEVRVTNQTDVEKTFRGVGWRGRFLHLLGEVSLLERQDLERETDSLLRAKPRLLTPQKVIEPKDFIQGWAVHSFDRPADLNVASSAFTLIAEDELRNRYRVEVPEMERRA